MAKARIPIPAPTAARVLYRADRTCSVCQTPGKAVQIHHLDEDPANNEIDNLAVLCFDCHDETQLHGGFARKLDAEQIILYRDGWHATVEAGRAGVAAVIEAEELGESRTDGTHRTANLSAVLAGIASLLPDWLDAVEVDPVVGAQFQATARAYRAKIRRLRPGGARFALEQREATELLKLSERHRDLVEIYATRTDELEPFVAAGLQMLDTNPEIWPLMAEFDGAVQVAAAIIARDGKPGSTGTHIYDYARQRVHESTTMSDLFNLWRVVRRLTERANATVMSWDQELAPHRAPATLPPDSKPAD